MATSTHRVEVIRIGEVEKHPNADLLGIVRVRGYRCCVKLSDFKAGDLAAYIVPDSVVPETPQFEFLRDKEGRFHGRIRVKRFRGELSQGLLFQAPAGAREGDDVAAALGVQRYVPPEPEEAGAYNEDGPAIGAYLPSAYDVEDWHAYGDVFAAGEEVVITEKVHGTNTRATFEDGRLRVGSRTAWKVEDKRVQQWNAVRNTPAVEAFCRAHPGLVLYGESFGWVMDLRYGAKRDDPPRFIAFDVHAPTGGGFLAYDEARALVDPFGVPWVPVVYRGPYDAKAAKALSNGPSLVQGASNMREGIVVRPARERAAAEVGRVTLKIVSDEYMLS